MGNIIFLNALEGELEFDRTVDFKSAMQQKSIGMGVGAKLLLSDTNDILGMLFFVNMKYKEAVIKLFCHFDLHGKGLEYRS